MATVDPRARQVLDRFQELKALRSGFDPSWQKISEIMLPSRTFQLSRQPGELRTRNVLDPIGILSAKRLAAFLYGYMLSPSDPWVAPNLIARDATTEEALWFEQVEVLMHARLSGPTSPIATQLFEAALDITAFGQNITFRSRRPGGLPRIQSVALSQCYIAANADDEIDQNYREFTLTARQAADKYQLPVLIDVAKERPQSILNLVHAVEPRPGGVVGAARPRKPWTSTLVWADKAMVLTDEGFDRMPYQIGRFERRSGEVYGSGPGWDAYPAVWTANAMAESVLRSAELANDPPTFGDSALFGGRLDRRPGAFNPMNGNALFGQRVGDMIGRLDIGGDVRLGVEMLERQRRAVEAHFFIDWLALREGPQMTATEVIDRRDLRLRMLAPVVARLEQEWLNPLVEDMFFAMLEAGMFPPAPRSLANQEIGFVYRSPLALAQRGATVEAIRKTFAIAAEAAQFDQTAPMALKADEMLREAARLSGVSEKRLRSFEEIEMMRAQQQDRQAAADDMAAAGAAAGALQQGAQGLASLAQIGAAPAAA